MNSSGILQSMQKTNPTGNLVRYIIAIAIFILAVPQVSLASPSVSSLKAKKQEIIRELDRLEAELEVAVEEYNEAVWKLSVSKKKARKLEAEIKDTEARIDELEKKIASRARSLYMLKTNPLLEAIAESESIVEVISGIRMISIVLSTEANLNQEYKQKKEKLEKDKAELAEVLKEQKRLKSIAEAKKKSIEAKIRKKERMLAGIDSQLREAIRRERESRIVAQARASSEVKSVRTRYYPSRGSDRDLESSDKSLGMRAVSIAYSLLGRPYRWGAAGPNAFDCSGLTMYVYGKLGVSLPHSSSAQYYCGRRVSYDELAPGDLVFFARRSGRISHVGIYVGGGMMIHAPQTGDVVKVVPLSSHGGYVGAVRPY